MAQNYNLDPSLKSVAISVTGADACKFLQGQLSCDVNALQENQSTLGAYCNIKGKVEALFNLERQASAYYLWLPESLAAATMAELQKYAVFSKVKLEISTQAERYADAKQEILAKIPAVYATTSGLFFPHDLNLPQLGAVSFTKGCFRGQEIIARMQHRGNLKRSLHGFRIEANNIVPGTIISAGGSENEAVAGTVVRSYSDNQGETIGLAVITDTMLQTQLYIGEPPVKLKLALL